MRREFVTEINGVKYKTKALPASRLSKVRRVLESVIPKLLASMGDLVDIKKFVSDKLLDVDVSEIMKSSSIKGGLLSGLSGVFTELQSQSQSDDWLLALQAGEPPYTDCNGGLLEDTYIRESDTDEWRKLNFDDDFAGAYEDSLYVTWWVLRSNFPRFFGLLADMEKVSQGGSQNS